MKITVITACYNSAATIHTAMESVAEQRGVEVDYIVVDGGSKDGTVSLLQEFEARVGNGERGTGNGGEADSTRLSFRWVSERDRGMYDAINKGIKMATGDVIGILNADDILESPDTLAKIAAKFEGMGNGERGTGNGEQGTGNGEQIEAVYADIRFVRDGDSLEVLRAAPTVRYCSAARWRPWMFRFGAMVPHPSFYVRRECFARLGGYSLDYRICADFELELRYLGLARLRSAYLPECVVTMRMGGASTAGWRSTVEINREDLRALRANGVWSCLPLLYLKYFFKIWGFVFKRKTLHRYNLTDEGSLIAHDAS